MSLVESARIALKSLVRNPGRSGLTILGLAIGVAAFIAMVSFGEGARASVVEQFQSFGINVLTVVREGARADGRSPAPLTDADLEVVMRETTTIDFVVPVARRQVVAVYEGRQVVASVTGTTARFVEIRDWGFTVGGMFDDFDIARRANVCVLGATPAVALFGERDPLDATITLDQSLRCRVIGVLESKGSATSGRDLDDMILVPAPVFRSHLSAAGERHYYFFDARPRDPGQRELARAELAEAMRRAHDLEPGEADDFVVRSPDDATRVADQVSQILTGLLAGIAAVSLLVGGIGIMNIQLVAVAERTQEIGIRSAIGAAPRQIMLQFLTEAVLLALVGTVIGALLGIGIAWGVAEAMRWSSSVPVYAVAGAAAFGAGVGVLFGYLPAQRAAQLDPIEALRRE